MDTVLSIREYALGLASAQTWMISLCVIVVLILVGVGVWYAAPMVSKMTSKKREYNIDEEELDRLIDSIHERQMPDGSRRRVRGGSGGDGSGGSGNDSYRDQVS